MLKKMNKFKKFEECDENSRKEDVVRLGKLIIP